MGETGPLTVWPSIHRHLAPGSRFATSWSLSNARPHMSVAESRRRPPPTSASGGGLALASVTALLKHFLENGLAERGIVAQLGGDVTVSALPLDRIASGPDEKAQ